MTSEESAERRQEIQERLENADSPEGIYRLFETAGYSGSTRDPSYTRKLSEFDFKDKASNRISEIFTVLEYRSEITVLLIETESLSNAHIRYVSERLARKFNHVLPIFTSEYRNYRFVLPTFDETTPGDLDIQLTTLKVDSDNVFYSDADALSRIWIEEERRYPHIWNQWRDAFSIDKVTEQFFEDYQDQFFEIREQVLKQIDDVHDAHEFTLQFMNRMMFVYFVDKKGWLEGEEGESYIQWLWNIYRKQGGLQQDKEDRFYSEYLTTLFHKSFNNKFLGNENLPEQVSRSYSRAPYLNGGLFRENELTELGVELGDELIGNVIEGFFERYNFTIKEDSPVEKQVAVDPQMIGYVYESLSNVAEELEDLDKDSRKEFGIFYTPKEEVYFMVRRSLVEYLDNNTEVSKTKIYRLVFAESDDEKNQAREEISSGEFNRITRTLRQMDAVDPACGSGAFLVGIIDVIAEIYRIAEGKDKRQFDMFETKKKIIQESIYGVDVKDWAINASELRLFLQLLIETDVDKEKIQQNALLPNLRANLRVGDSLVQDIDGMFFDLRRSQLSVDSKTWMDEIQKEKSYFFDSRSKSKYNNIGDIKGDEIKFFRQVIHDKIDELEDRLDDESEKQQTLGGETKEPSGNEKRRITRKRKKTKERIGKLENLKREVTQTQEKMPLIWEVAFAEVFNTEEEDESGFDLLIGNPPYVRQEDIAPPNMDPDEVTKQDKKDYKNKLIKSVQNRVPQVEKISKRSDLYIYFYFHGLSLINDQGTFAFITSNSWLDVGYGKELQKFLCKHVPIKGIYNNKNNRSFEHADVNTVISVFGAPNFETKSFNGWEVPTDVWPETDHEAQFVTFKKPYREAVSAENMIALENDTHYDKEIQLDRSSFELYNTGDLRSVQITQGNLLEDGWQYPENFEGETFSKGKYKLNKWGSKFLRAKDILFTIFDKSRDDLRSISDICEKTQRNTLEVFDSRESKKRSEIENIEQYIPYLSSVKDTRTISVKEDDLPKMIREKKGENPRIKKPDIISNRFYNDRMFFVEGGNFVVGDTFFVGFLKDNYPKRETVFSLNSTLSIFMTESFGRSNLGGGALSVYGPELEAIMMLDPNEIEIDSENILNREIESIFKEIGIERNKPIREQEPSPLSDRKELDDIVFDALGLSEGERKEVYWSVAELVKARLDKAESV